jgi:Flp pilus assembly protein CpaB
VKLSKRRMSAPSLGGVLATRQGSLMLAVLCAICAAGVLVFALGRYKTNVTQQQGPQVVPQTSVLVATGEITKGMTGTEIAKKKLYKVEPISTSAVTLGAITDAGELSAQSAVSDILPGQQLTTTDFSELASVSLILNKGERAVEIAISGAPGAVDITNPDSRVDIYGKDASSTVGGVTESSIGTSAPGAYQLIQQNVRVLKPATSTPVTIGNQSVSGSTLVLIVARSHVEQLITDVDSLYLVLRPGKSGALPVTPTIPTAATTTAGAS